MKRKPENTKGRKLEELKFPPQQKDLPASQGMLQLVRKEVKIEIRELRSEMNGKFKQVDARFDEINGRFNEMDGKFHLMDAKFDQLSADVCRIGILMEEQNSRNQIVLEGLTGLFQRQDRQEQRMDHLEVEVHSYFKHRV